MAIKLLPYSITHHKHQVGRTFCHAPQQVRVPLRAIRNIDAHIVSLADQLFLQIAPDAVEHLELESSFTDAVVTRILAGSIDDSLVMRGDGGIIPVQEQHRHEPDIIMIDLALVLECHGLRLLVCSLDEAHAYSLRDQLLGVLLTAIQARLYHRAHVLKSLMHTQRDIYRLLGIGRAFHIDTHEYRELLSMFEDTNEVLFA